MTRETLSEGSKDGAIIRYSAENVVSETAGGIANARHLQGEEPFVAIASDGYRPHFDFEQVKNMLEDNDLSSQHYPLDKRDVAWLYLVKNPSHHPHGYFFLNSFSVNNQREPGHTYTYSDVGVYRPEMFDAVSLGQPEKLVTLMRKYATLGQLGDEVYRGAWTDVGTIERLDQLNAPL